MRRALTLLSCLAALVALLTALPAGAAAAPLHWSAAHQIDGAGGIGLAELACPAATQCDAIDSDGRLLQFDPAAPGRPTPVALGARSGVSALACATATQCTALDGDGGVATFDPADPGSLTFTTVDPGADGADALACPSSSECVIGDSTGNVVSFDPASPAAVTTASLDPHEDFGILAVACVSSTQCTAISQTTEWTLDPADPSAATSARIDTAAGFAHALTCASATQCTAVDQSGREATFDPQTGSVAAPVALGPGPYIQLVSVACTSAAQCVAADDYGHLISFDPETGLLTATLAQPSVYTVACPTVGGCVAGETAGRLVTFTPASAAAPTVTRIDAGTPLLDLACPGRAQCTAVDSEHELTFNPLSRTAATYRRALPGRVSPTLPGIACPTLTLCDVTRLDAQTSFDPRSFGAPRDHVVDHDGDGTLLAVSCPSSAECVSIDSDGVAVSYDPRTDRILRKRIDVEVGEALTALACSSRTQCTATDNDGAMVTFDPLTGHRVLSATIDTKVGLDAPSGDSDNELDGIACHGASLCVAVDTLGNEVSFDPRSRRGARLAPVDPSGGLTAVSCPSQGRCVLTDSDGLIWTGAPRSRAWTSTRPRGAAALTSVACVSDRECVAVDVAGDEFTAR